MLGVGGVLAEALGDVAFRRRPARPTLDADELIDDLATQKLLGEFRGEPAVDRAALRATLLGLSRLADRAPRRRRRRRQPAHRRRRQARRRRRPRRARPPAPNRRRQSVLRDRPVTPVRDLGRGLPALFEPRGVIVAGASTPSGQVRVRRAAQHPRGRLRGQGRRDESRRHAGARHRHRRAASTTSPTARGTSCSCARRPAPTPTSCARARARGVRAAFLTSAGYGEAGDDGPPRRSASSSRSPTSSASCSPGPNGQGVVSTPAHLCAQIVAPNPPAGPDRDREPVGQLRVVVRELGRRRPASA